LIVIWKIVFMQWRGVGLLAENLADKIRDQETQAKKIIADAKVESANLLAFAHANAEESLKSTKQQCHREWRESVSEAEKAAEIEAEKIMAKGEAKALSYYEEKKGSVKEVAKWLVKEVMATYGS